MSQNFNLLYVFKGSAIYGVSEVITAAIRFFLIAILTRVFTPSDFGVYSIIVATITFTSIILPIGIPSATMINFGPDLKSNNILKNSAFLFLLKICIIGALIFYLLTITLFKYTIIEKLFLWIVILCVCDVLSYVPKASLRFNQKIFISGIAKIIRSLIMLGFLFFLLYWQKMPGIISIFVAEAFGALCEFFLCLYFDKFIPSLIIKKDLIFSLFSSGLPFLLVTLGFLLNDLSNRYIVFLILGQNANGYFSAAARISWIGSFFSEALNAMWFPYFFMLANNNNIIKHEIENFSKRMILLCALLVSFISILIPNMVYLNLFGKYFIAPKYHSIIGLIAPLTIAYFFKMVLYVFLPILSYNKKTINFSFIILAGALVNIGLTSVIAIVFKKLELFILLKIIAFIISFSYLFCIVLSIKESNFFKEKRYFTSKIILFCAILVIIPFLPFYSYINLLLWLLICFIIYRTYFLNSNFLKRLFIRE
jgi:O-antigen/teichoic acid export membrane protein